MPQGQMLGLARPLHVSLIAIPDGVVSTLTGIYDVMSSFGMLAGSEPTIPDRPPFRVEIVGAAAGRIALASGIPVKASRGFDEVAATDIVIVPSILLGAGGWRTGRYPGLVEWASRMIPGQPACRGCLTLQAQPAGPRAPPTRSYTTARDTIASLSFEDREGRSSAPDGGQRGHTWVEVRAERGSKRHPSRPSKGWF